MKNFDQNKFNADDNYKRFVSYGNCAIESFVVDNKLDGLFLFDEPDIFVDVTKNDEIQYHLEAFRLKSNEEILKLLFGLLFSE